MRVLVTGDRNWDDAKIITEALQALPDDGCLHIIIHGAARGADSIAADIAMRLGMTPAAFPAKWKEYGRAAGPIRNQQMLDEGQPELILAFHDDLLNSKGTKDMVRRALKAKFPILLYSHRHPEGERILTL